MKTFDRLRERIKNDLGIEGENFRSLKTGRNQKTSGAMSWVAWHKGTNVEFGSAYTATDLLKSKGKLIKHTQYFEHYDEIFPAD